MNLGEEKYQSSISALEKIQKIEKLLDATDSAIFSPKVFFQTNLDISNQYLEGQCSFDEKLSSALKSFKKAFEQNIDAYENLILNSKFVSMLIQILLKIQEEIGSDSKSKKNYIPNHLQLILIQKQIFDILKIMSNCSNPIIKMILEDNKLFDHLFPMVSTIKCSEQAISYFQLFHSYFEKFPNISYYCIIPNECIENIKKFISFKNVTNQFYVQSYVLTFFNDLLTNVELSEAQVEDLLVSAILSFTDFSNLNKLESACELVILLIRKVDDVIKYFYEEPLYLEYFSYAINELPNQPVVNAGCHICSVIDEIINSIPDEESKLKIIQMFDPQKLYEILAKTDPQQKNISYIVSLISKHLELKSITLEDFISQNGYKTFINLLSESSFYVKVIILNFFSKISTVFGWESLPDDSFPRFFENCVDLLTFEDKEIFMTFYTGFNNALTVADPTYHQKVLKIYSETVGVEDFLRNLQFNGNEEMRLNANQILSKIDVE